MDDLLSNNLLEPEFAPHYETWKKSPTPANASNLLRASQPVLDAAVRSYGGTNPSPTLRSRARLMALDAFQRYDPARAKLRTHLMVHLQGLRRQAARENQMISVPERVALDLHRVHNASTELQDRLFREPSDAELSEHTGLSIKRLAHIRKAKPAYSEGFIQDATASDEDQGGFTPAVVGRDDASAWNDFVYHDLDAADQLIMEHTLGLHGKRVLPKQEIARRLGISAGAVSQRAARIQEKLNQREATGLL